MIQPRDENPSRRARAVTLALVAANVGAFAWQVLGPGVESSIRRGGAIPYEILTFEDVEWRALVPPPLTVLTAMFLHAGAGHLAVNVVALWLFGNAVEGALGRLRLLLLYVACGVAAALAQTLGSAMAGDVLTPAVGASGAVAGVLAAYLVLFPRRRFPRWVPLRLLRLPAGFFIVAWFLGQVASAAMGPQPGVAVFAHIGGFVAGWLLVRWMRPGEP